MRQRPPASMVPVVGWPGVSAGSCRVRRGHRAERRERTTQALSSTDRSGQCVGRVRRRLRHDRVFRVRRPPSTFARQQQTARQIADATDSGIAHISRALSDLQDRVFVELLVAEERHKGRIWADRRWSATVGLSLAYVQNSVLLFAAFAGSVPAMLYCRGVVEKH